MRGTNKLFFQEAERLLKNCFKLTKLFLERSSIWRWLVEFAVAQQLRHHSTKLNSEDQIVTERVAETFESIPMVLAELTGLDRIDSLVEMCGAYSKGVRTSCGVDGFGRKISDLKRHSIVGPLHTKGETAHAAIQTAITILRINQIIQSRRLPKEAYYVERMEKTSTEATRKIYSKCGI